MDDFDNLPFGTTNIDGSNAGVSKWDDRQTAFAKVMTADLAKQHAQWGEHFQSGQDLHAENRSAEINHIAASGKSIGDLSDYEKSEMHVKSITQISHLVNIVEAERLTLLYKREEETKAARTWRKVAWLALAVSIVFYGRLGFFLFNLLIFAGSFFLIFKTSSYISKSISQRERQLNVIAGCMIKAFKSSYDVRKFGSAKCHMGNRYRFLLGKFYVPQGVKGISAKFLFNLNKNINIKSGQTMPYFVYRFLPVASPNGSIFIQLDESLVQTAVPYAEPVSLEELEYLANQPTPAHLQ